LSSERDVYYVLCYLVTLPILSISTPLCAIYGGLNTSVFWTSLERMDL
jgi:hypothetical protein